VLQIQNKKDSLKLQELEELIDIQNQELEALIDDKNDFINEIENFVRLNKSSLNETNVSKLESSIENLINAFYKKIDEFETSFNDKFVNLDLSSLNNSLQDSQSQSLKEIKEQLVSNYEVIKNILKSELDKIIEDIQNHNMVEEQNFEKINNKFNEFKTALQNLSLNADYSSFDTVNNLANSLNTEFDDLVGGLKTNKNDLDLQEKVQNSALSNKKFDLFINELDEKIKSLEKNDLVDDFKKWWVDFKNSATLFAQGDSINLVLESNKINQIEINEYIKKLEKQNSYLENELKKEQEKFSILKIKEIEELIDAQNSEISLLLSDWERLIFELERYLQNVLNITSEKYDESSLGKIADLNSSLGDVINRFKSKVDNLENSFKNKISNINEGINSVDN
ncbi:MAG: hypothetical protein K2G48_01370, partial [Malacoplasma sp.]|nr:hypothetical protein [Malacoplasma sp.]